MPLQGVEALRGQALVSGGKTAKGTSFEDFLSNIIQDLDKTQKQADDSIRKLASGQPTSIQDVVLKLEEADLTFRLMKEVRDKLIAAYKEVMAMNG